MPDADKDAVREHLTEHLTDGRWHDSCGYCQRRRVHGGTGVTSPAVGRVCPECQQGKHQNCDGTAWDDAADAPGRCACTDGSHR